MLYQAGAAWGAGSRAFRNLYHYIVVVQCIGTGVKDIAAGVARAGGELCRAGVSSNDTAVSAACSLLVLLQGMNVSLCLDDV